MSPTQCRVCATGVLAARQPRYAGALDGSTQLATTDTPRTRLHLTEHGHPVCLCSGSFLTDTDAPSAAISTNPKPIPAPWFRAPPNCARVRSAAA